MNVHELRARVAHLQDVLSEVTDNLRTLRDGPGFDEDYKLDWYTEVHEENLNMAIREANALASRLRRIVNG